MKVARVLRIGVTFGVLVLGATASADRTTSPGKNSVHVSTIGVALPIGVETVMLTGVIAHGKRGRVLTVDASVGSVAPGEAGTFRPTVNGVALETTDDLGTGTSMTINCASTATYGCTGTGHWWLDLDAAEAASPGTFIGKSLEIRLLGSGAAPLGVHANMSARLEKK